MKRKNKIIQNRHIYIDDFFSDKEKILRKINTNVFTYLFFVCSGLILLIVASILFFGKGVTYTSSNPNSMNINSMHANSTLVLGNASNALFIIGGLFVGSPIIINFYIIYKIRKDNILSNNIPSKIKKLLLFGLILQIPSYVGMILLYKELKNIHNNEL